MPAKNKDNEELPILYVCPYCKKGRFTAEDGFEGAKRHIREKHPYGARNSMRRGRNSRHSDPDDDNGLLGGEPFE